MQVLKFFFNKAYFIESCSKLSIRTGNNQSGYSLAEVLAASAVSSIIAIGSASLVAQSRNVANIGEYQTNLDIRHTLNVQKVKNTALLLEAISITPVTLAQDCFKRNGTSCDTAYGMSVPAAVPPILKDTSDPSKDDVINGASTDGLIDMAVTYQVNCTATKCTNIQVQILTQPSTSALARGYIGKIRRTSITIPSSFLTDKRSLEFTCVSDSTGAEILTSINYMSQKADCLSYVATTTTCTGNSLPKSYGDPTPGCQAMAATSCANGYKNSGPFSSQVVCY